MITNHQQVVPAQPGYYILEPLYDDNGMLRELARIPIVAWIVTYNFVKNDESIKFPHAEPVTYEGFSHGSWRKNYAILSPYGTVEEPFDCAWDTLEDYFNYLRRKHERKNYNA